MGPESQDMSVHPSKDDIHSLRNMKEEFESLEEDAMLDVYLKSRGLNPATITTDKKIAYAKGSDFLRWKQNHS
jgi:hypothetical protein